jgi:hypothetical protein
MRSAHQGVPMATLPSVEPHRSAIQDLVAPRLSAPVEPARAQPQRRNDLDGWFIDRLFSRR